MAAEGIAEVAAMGERRMPTGLPSRARKRSALPMLLACAAVFLALLTLLAARLAAGADPALRALSAAHPIPRQVLVRRVYERIVITHLPPSAPERQTRSAQQVSSAGASEAAAAVVTRAS
ncbi:MAG: hypothetical protein KGJ43_08965 [Acidobacteriota bacterium]|nr:hypothetical protein [Acidobacteriota bacterium]